MDEILDILFLRTWWQYDRDRHFAFSEPYHWFNLIEGSVWIVFALVVVRRFAIHRKSRIEMAYGFAFLTFAASDFVEAWVQASWLIWLKLVNLIALLYLRQIVMSRFYPDAKVC